MALIHRATLVPTKLDLLAAWLPDRSWYTASDGELQRVATYRFDDPADEVGIETMLVRAGDGPVHQVPLTYRGAPLVDGDAWLLGTTEHSVLGKRWVYDACGDPVYAAALTRAIFENTGPAAEYVDVDGRLEPRELSMNIASGPEGKTAPAIGALQHVTGDDPIRIVTDTVELTVLRVLDGRNGLTGVVLTGVWPGQETPTPLAAATLR